MSAECARVRRRLVACVALALTIVAAGCGGASRYPVEGRVLVKGAPLKGKEGHVLLKPDAAKGNTSTVPAMGVLERDGSFNALSNGQAGVRAGWYKVIVVAAEPGGNPNDDLRRAINARYETEASTPLAIEVVANPTPGSYDLKLSP
jgi:hypothetical protein